MDMDSIDRRLDALEAENASLREEIAALRNMSTAIPANLVAEPPAPPVRVHREPAVTITEQADANLSDADC